MGVGEGEIFGCARGGAGRIVPNVGGGNVDFLTDSADLKPCFPVVHTHRQPKYVSKSDAA